MLSVSVMADKIEFYGNYRTNQTGTKENGKWNVMKGGCIYHGKFPDGRIVKVYTKESCSVVAGKGERTGGQFSCEVNSATKTYGKGKYLMYEGTCEVI